MVFKLEKIDMLDFADLIANENPHNYVHNHNLERFEKGINIDERGAGPDPKLHG